MVEEKNENEEISGVKNDLREFIELYDSLDDEEKKLVYTFVQGFCAKKNCGN